MTNEKDINKTEISNDYRQLKHLPQSALLEESGSPKFILLVILVTAGILFFFIFWASVTYVDEVATASGELLPVNKIQEVQQLEGGVVSQIFVKNGDKVLRDKVLLQLSPTAANSELEKTRSRQLSLMLDLERLHAFVEDRELNFKTLSQFIREKYHGDDILTVNALIADTIEFLNYQKLARRDDIKILELQLNQKIEEYAKAKEKRTSSEKQAVIFQEEQKIYKSLESMESVAKTTLIELEKKATNSQSDLLETKSDLNRASQALEEAKKRFDARDSQLKKEALQEISDKNGQLLDANATISRLEDRVIRLTVRAPGDGLVKGFDSTLGSVVAAGSKIMELVPFNQELMAEIHLKTQDIGHVKIGDHANVKITTFDFVRYGLVEGVVDTISASTFLDAEAKPFYKVTIKLEKSYVGNDLRTNKLIPGMVVVSDIITGNKSLISYFLKPIHRSLQEAFRER